MCLDSNSSEAKKIRNAEMETRHAILMRDIKRLKPRYGNMCRNTCHITSGPGTLREDEGKAEGTTQQW